MERLEDLYQREQIYKAWVICGSDEEAIESARWLDERHHTVVCITTEDVEDERVRYMQKLHHFQDSARMIVMSYQAWAAIKEEVEVHVLPEQNLIAFGKIEIELCSFIARYIADAATRGFRSSYGNDASVVFLYQEENIM